MEAHVHLHGAQHQPVLRRHRPAVVRQVCVSGGAHLSQHRVKAGVEEGGVQGGAARSHQDGRPDALARYKRLAQEGKQALSGFGKGLC